MSNVDLWRGTCQLFIVRGAFGMLQRAIALENQKVYGNIAYGHQGQDPWATEAMAPVKFLHWSSGLVRIHWLAPQKAQFILNYLQLLKPLVHCSVIKFVMWRGKNNSKLPLFRNGCFSGSPYCAILSELFHLSMMVREVGISGHAEAKRVVLFFFL